MVAETDKTNLASSGGDLVITEGVLQMVSGEEGVVQAADSRLKLFMGEWFLDLNAGFPYFQLVFRKNPVLGPIKTNIIKTLASVPGIDVESNVLSVEFTMDNINRTMIIDWKAKSVFGVITSTTIGGV